MTVDVRHMDSLGGIVRVTAARLGDAPALEGRDEHTLSYRDLSVAIDGVAAQLRGNGLRRGDRVLVLLEGDRDWAPVCLGVLQAGLVAVPLVDDTPCEALSAIAAAASAGAVIFSDRTRERVERLSGMRSIAATDLLCATGAGRPDRVSPSSDDVAMLAFTSGTTSRPRAVQLTHGNLLADVAALLEVRQAAPGDRFLSILSPAHLFELVCGLLAPLACGACVGYSASRLPNRLVESLRRRRITHAIGVPALVRALYAEILEELIPTGIVASRHRGTALGDIANQLESGIDEEQRARLRLGVQSRIGKSFRLLAVGGAAVDPALVRVVAALGIRVEVGYGLTEAAPVVSLGFADTCPSGSVGQALPGIEVRVDNRGEILVRGPNVMRGYFGDPEATREALADGWLHTGDRGHVDDDGFLFVHGRLKEVIVTAAGETIYPEEAEGYYASPLFGDFCVAGVPGADGNDTPVLFAVPRGEDISAQAMEGAFADLRSRAPSRFRVRHMVTLTDPLPRTALGKVRRRELVERWKEFS